MRAFVLAAALAVAVPAAAQTPGGLGSRGDSHARADHRGHRAHRVETNVDRFERDLRAAARRGNDASRDAFSGFRWNSDFDAGAPGDRRRDLCRRGRCEDDVGSGGAAPGVRLGGPDRLGSSEAAWFEPAPPARPVVRRLDGRRVVRGPSQAAAPSFAIRTLGGGGAD